MMRSIEAIAERAKRREAERAAEVSAQRKRKRHVKRQAEIETAALVAVATGQRPQLADAEHFAIRTVESPYHHGRRVEAVVSLRDDPLGRLHKRRQIDDAQFQAGRKWQADWEEAEIGGARAIDPSREGVDGGRIPEPWNERQMAATARLARCARWLGNRDNGLVRDVLGDRMSLARCAEVRGLPQKKRDLEYLGRRLRDSLNTLAFRLGFAIQAPSRFVRDDDSALAEVVGNPRLYAAVHRAQMEA